MEYEAVVLGGGKGSRMNELTRGKTPKCLLPIANKPLIWYPLKMLENHGFTEAIVIILEPFRSALLKALIDAGSLKNLKLDVVEIPDADWGTADSLRHIKDKVSRDLMVVSCDLITNLNLQLVADAFRVEDAALTCLLSPLAKQWIEAVAPGPKTKRKGMTGDRDFVGLEPKESSTSTTTSRLLFLANEADVEDDVVSFKKSLFKRHPRMLMRSKILDGHLYLMKRWVLDLLEEKKSKATLKGEFIPYLLANQFAGSKRTNSKQSGETEGVNESLTKKSVQDFVEQDSWIDMLSKLSNAPATFNLSPSPPCPVRCNALLAADDAESVFVRVNTTAAFCEANKAMLRLMPHHFQELTSKSPSPDPSSNAPTTSASTTSSTASKTGIVGDSLVGDGTSLGLKSHIKKSVIGKNCQIGSNVRIVNSVVLDNVVIGDDVTVTGCLLLEDTEVKEKTEIKDSVVASGCVVEPKSKITNESIVKNLMEI